MASIQDPEVQFAQRLASNEKHIRTKAVKKLRKYITVRSQKETGGFTGDELLKLWKGLFYCLWMQDKPLVQEELSNQISTLIHSFHNIDGQFLYFESFLQTFKREWTGIDRLRMDKFFQLVRFMFRQTFELLKRTNWEKSVVARFLEILTAQLLQSSSGAPAGLQFHILDLYMTELAAVASAELTADQNLIFIEPFCKTAAKTKEQSLFRAICNSIFSTIIDQAPFAIEDLMKEVEANEASDSGQASEEDDEDQLKQKTEKSKPVSKKKRGKQINGNKSHAKRGDDGQSDDSDDELLYQEDSDTEVLCDDDIGPVLQFDYAALADKLFELASRSNIPSQNRQRLYKIIKVLRDLSEGIFPQDEYPEDVSTDEDDDMFGSRIRMKRRGDIVQNEDGVPAAKKSKGKKNASTLDKKNKDLGTDNKLADCTVNNENQKKKRKKKKKKVQDASTGGEENAKISEQEQIVSSIKETERGPQYLQAEYLENETQMQSSVSSVIVRDAATSEGQSETQLLSEVKKQSSAPVKEENRQPTPSTTDNKDQSETLSRKKKKRKTSELKPEDTEEAGEHQTPVRTEPEMSTKALTPVSRKTKKKKGLKVKIQTDGNAAELQVSEEAEITLESGEVSAELNKPTLETDATTPAKKKKKGLKAKKNDEAVEGASQINYVSTETDIPSVPVKDTVEDGLTISFEQTTSSAPIEKRSKKNSVKAVKVQGVEADAQLKAERKCLEAEITSVGDEASLDPITVLLTEKTKGKGYTNTLPAADKSTVTPQMTKRKKDQKEFKTVEETEVKTETAQVANTEKVLFDITMKTPTKGQKKNQKLAAVELNETKDPTQLEVVDNIVAELPLNETKVLSSSGKRAKKKKISVVFEFEADELEAAKEAASINGLAEEGTVAKKSKQSNDVGDPSTPLRTQKSQKKAKNSSPSDFITIQRNAAVPTPIFCKTKGNPGTVLSSKKKSQTPKSESKKVTFGLKNNKTAEFRKTDRSLLVSPAGSSRVAFDPKQKPKFGVLKSPTPRSASSTATPSSYRKTSLNTPKSTPKQRPSAADFF